MSSIPLKIFLHGLIALAPVSNNGVTSMKALFVDARVEHPGACESAHHLKVRFLAPVIECSAVGCHVSLGQQCTCDDSVLAGKDIWIKITPTPDLATQPSNKLPEDSREAARFSYVANLSREPFELTLTQGFLGSLLPEQFSGKLLARMDVPFKTITACSLVRREENGEANIHALSFRKLDDLSQKDEAGQALAQRVVAEVAVPDAEMQGVELHFRDFHGMNEKQVTMRPGSSGYRIDVSNEPDRLLDRDSPCNDGIARYFTVFYDFAEPAPQAEGIYAPGLAPSVCDASFFNP